MIAVGATVSAFEHSPITQEQLRLYAEASGDYNPIHLDEEVARKVGLPGVIAHGMLIAGFVADRALMFLEENVQFSSFRLSRIQTRFKGMTLLGDTISVSGTVKDSSVDRLSLDLQARNQRGEVVCTGNAVFERRLGQS